VESQNDQALKGRKKVPPPAHRTESQHVTLVSIPAWEA